jgi:hypothetical protein
VLARGEAFQHFLIDRLVAHAIDESLDHLEVDVRFEQRHADLAQRDLDGLLRQANLAADGPEDVLKAITERIEHGIARRCHQVRSPELPQNDLTGSHANVYRNRGGSN